MVLGDLSWVMMPKDYSKIFSQRNSYIMRFVNFEHASVKFHGFFSVNLIPTCKLTHSLFCNGKGEGRPKL